MLMERFKATKISDRKFQLKEGAPGLCVQRPRALVTVIGMHDNGALCHFPNTFCVIFSSFQHPWQAPARNNIPILRRGRVRVRRSKSLAKAI